MRNRTATLDFLKVLLIYVGAFFIFSVAQAQTDTPEAKTEVKAEAAAEKAEPKKDTAKKDAKKKDKKKMKAKYADFETSEGNFRIELFTDKVPKTVENFVSLAEGTNTKANKKGPFYDGLIFHRVIEGFMIQGGCPEGSGRGGPGYKFEDEFDASLKHDKPGILSMANAGPNTNGSQFFVTVAPTPHLNNRHSVFGQVIDGMDVVMKISRAPKDRMDKPSKEIKIKHVKIVRE